MLTHANNELLCRVGPGTPMGELMRQYWIPALPSSFFPGPDSPAKRMRLLGEDFVMFRDSQGRMGALEQACPHRGASLHLGRNEEGGIRCPYHGWKFDITGKCLETPTEQPERRERFCATIKARAFPCHEVNHMVWVYMGPRETPPPFPLFELNTLPSDRVGEPQIMMEEANYLQNLEGDVDSVHLDWVHRRLHEDSPKPEKGIRGFWNPTGLPPVLDVERTPYGAFYSARRPMPDGSEWHRINQFIFPFHTMITQGDGSINLRSFVPLDDHYAMLISQHAHPLRPLKPSEEYPLGERLQDVGGFIEPTSDPRTYFMTKVNKSNDYGRDFKVEKESMMCGIPFSSNLQDRAMTEFMTNAAGEPICDRTKEHLSNSDLMVVTVRRQLLEAVTALRDHGRVPDNVDQVELNRVRSASLNLPAGADWRTMSADERRVNPDKASSSQVSLILP